MPRQDLLINLEDALSLGIESSNAEIVRRARVGAMQVLTHAALTRSGEDLRRLEADLGDAHVNLVLKHGWKPEADLKAEAWMLAAVSSLAGMVAALLPKKVALTEDQGTKRALILIALLESNEDAMSNSDLAARVDARPETVKRALDSARQDGLVESWRQGRLSMNSLTPAGVEYAHVLKNARADDAAFGDCGVAFGQQSRKPGPQNYMKLAAA